MSCSHPLTFETLVDYWAGDLSAEASASVEEHLFGCDTCTAAATRVAAVCEALRTAIPPVVSRARLERLRAEGKRVRENAFAPGAAADVWFLPDVDLLIHRLGGLSLNDVDRVDLRVTAASTGELIAAVEGVPFEPSEGAVLVACQRHYASLPPDTIFTVSVHPGDDGPARTSSYSLFHRFQ